MPGDKAEKKRIKAELKAAKARAKTQRATGSADSGLPPGVGILVREADGRPELVVSGLQPEQLERLIPQLSKEVLITVAEETHPVKAGLMRFVREGLFQTVVKVVAGLIVGYLLLQFGLG